MNFDETPEELLSPPEKRLTETLITQQPRKHSRTLVLSTLIFVVMFTQAYWLDIGHLSAFMPASQSSVFGQWQIWRIFTATLIHANVGHLLSNLYMLGILSFFVYGYFGLGIFPFSSFLVAALVNLISIYTYAPQIRLLGASGWVYVLGGFWLSMHLFIQRQYPLSNRTIRVIGIALLIFFPTSFEANTSYRTHFIGFIAGIVMAILYFSINKRAIRAKESYQLIP